MSLYQQHRENKTKDSLSQEKQAQTVSSRLGFQYNYDTTNHLRTQTDTHSHSVSLNRSSTSLSRDGVKQIHILPAQVLRAKIIWITTNDSDELKSAHTATFTTFLFTSIKNCKLTQCAGVSGVYENSSVSHFTVFVQTEKHRQPFNRQMWNFVQTFMGWILLTSVILDFSCCSIKAKIWNLRYHDKIHTPCSPSSLSPICSTALCPELQNCQKPALRSC